MAALIYFLCAITAGLCTVLLWRAYKSNGARLLFWSASSFLLLTANNVALVLDKLFVERDLQPVRLATALAAVLLLLFGLVWEED